MFVAAAATAFISCSKDLSCNNETPALSGETKIITLNTQIGETRTILDGHTVKWVDGDKYGIFFAGADGKIISYADSPAYVEGKTDYEVTAPAEAEYLYCFYPLSACETTYEREQQIGKSAVTLSIGNEFIGYWESDYEEVYYNYMAANAKLAGNSANVAFTPIVSILEFNIFDSTGSDNSQAGNLRIAAGGCAGSASVDFSNGGVAVEGPGDWDWFNVSLFNANFYIGTEAEPLKVYAPIFKGSYKTMEITVQTDEKSYPGYYYEYSNVNIAKDGYTINLDLSTAGDKEIGSTGGVGNPLGDALIESDSNNSPSGKFEEFVEMNADDPNYNPKYPDIIQWRMAAVGKGSGSMFISFGNWPSNYAVTYLDVNATRPAGDNAGALMMYSALVLADPGEYWIYFYKSESMGDPIEILYITFSRE